MAENCYQLTKSEKFFSSHHFNWFGFLPTAIFAPIAFFNNMAYVNMGFLCLATMFCGFGVTLNLQALYTKTIQVLQKTHKKMIEQKEQEERDQKKANRKNKRIEYFYNFVQLLDADIFTWRQHEQGSWDVVKFCVGKSSSPKFEIRLSFSQNRIEFSVKDEYENEARQHAISSGEYFDRGCKEDGEIYEILFAWYIQNIKYQDRPTSLADLRDLMIKNHS